jgi:hypothetical protein
MKQLQEVPGAVVGIGEVEHLLSVPIDLVCCPASAVARAETTAALWR